MLDEIEAGNRSVPAFPIAMRLLFPRTLRLESPPPDGAGRDGR
jgi:hypothetical protein